MNIPKKKRKKKQKKINEKGKILQKKKIIMVTLFHMWNLAKYTSLRSSPFEQKTLFSSAQLEKHKLTLVCFHVHTRKAEGREERAQRSTKKSNNHSNLTTTHVRPHMKSRSCRGGGLQSGLQRYSLACNSSLTLTYFSG